MSDLYASLSYALIPGWLLYVLARCFIPGRQAVAIGAILGILAFLIARETVPVMVFASLLGPPCVGLSFLVLRSFGREFAQVQSISLVEQVAFLSLLIFYYLLSIGSFFPDAFRLGYNPIFSGLLALSLCFYFALRSYRELAVLPVVAQFTWVIDLGSSNYFDHIFNVLMFPVLTISIFTSWLKKR